MILKPRCLLLLPPNYIEINNKESVPVKLWAYAEPLTSEHVKEEVWPDGLSNIRSVLT